MSINKPIDIVAIEARSAVFTIGLIIITDLREVTRLVKNKRAKNKWSSLTLIQPLLYGAETLHQAEALLYGTERVFGLDTLSLNFERSAMHQTLLAAYDKLFAADAA